MKPMFKRQTGFAPIIILILVLALAGAGAYMIWQNSQPKSQLSNSPSPSPDSVTGDDITRQIILNKAKELFEKSFVNYDVTIGDVESLSYPNDTVVISGKDLVIDREWGFGKASPPRDLILYIAHKDGEEWTVVSELDELYKTWFQQLPDTLVAQETKDFYKNR